VSGAYSHLGNVNQGDAMSQVLPAGPFKTFQFSGRSVALYVIPFDKQGACTAAQTRAHLLETLSDTDYTDVYMFCHGWNNDWETACARYEDFIQGYADLRVKRDLSYPRDYKPLLVGIFWPSTALVLSSEEAPAMAAHAASSAAEDLSEEVPESQRARFGQLLRDSDKLNAEGAQELANIMAPLWNRFQQVGTERGDLTVDAITPQDLLTLWRRNSASAQEDEFGGLADAPATEPDAAFSFGDVLALPRDFARTFTVLHMKDRAVRVGGSGASALLQDVSQRTAARVHLIGHSYGCIVMLSALAAAPADSLPRKIDSVLLLQAAVSRYCFAEKVPGKSYPGGYRVVFDRVTQPLLATYTKHDGPLTLLFHLAVRRDADLGQPVIAGAPKAPSKYAALGGFGPDGCKDGEYEYQPIHGVGEPYELANPGLRVIALQSDEAIKGHGDISVPQTWWALYNQVRTG
jgi:hypothetical protein